jgi:hypothetical protein
MFVYMLAFLSLRCLFVLCTFLFLPLSLTDEFADRKLQRRNGSRGHISLYVSPRPFTLLCRSVGANIQFLQLGLHHLLFSRSL